MKRAYLVNGTITVSVKPKDTVIFIDAETYNYLNQLLDDDYCYLILNNVEIIKVLACVENNSVIVERGIDNTPRSISIVGANIKYKTTSIEILDAVNSVGYILVAAGQLNIDSIGNITYGEYALVGLGGISIQGNGPWRIEDIPDNAGCGLDTPTEIPVNLQPYRVLDTGEARTTDDGSYREYV